MLAGRYRLLDVVGHGGMAVVHRGHDDVLDRDVAIKLLRPAYANDEDFVARFRREARHAASLHHPNIVTIYDRGIDPEFEHGLHRHAARGRPRPRQAARRRGPPSARAGAAHRRRDDPSATSCARPRHRPSGCEAGKHPDRPRRQRPRRRLRHRPGRQREQRNDDRRHPRHRRSTRAHEQVLGERITPASDIYFARCRAVRRHHRSAALRRTVSRGGRAREAPGSPRAAECRAPRPPSGDRSDHPARARARSE